MKNNMVEIIKMNSSSVRGRVKEENLFDPRYDQCIMGLKESSDSVCYNINKLRTSCIEMVYEEFPLQIEMGEMDDHEICKLGLSYLKSFCITAKSWSERYPSAPIICNDLDYLSTFSDLTENSRSSFKIRMIEE